MANDTPSKAVRQADELIERLFRTPPHQHDYMRLYDLVQRLHQWQQMPEAARERVRPVMLCEIDAVLSAVHDPYTDDIA